MPARCRVKPLSVLSATTGRASPKLPPRPNQQSRKRIVATECIKCIKKHNENRIYVRVHGKEEECSQSSPESEQSVGVRMALNLLVMYKTIISPLLPPSCRFQPTCSAYAMDAYTEYGVGKGTIMTAWRLCRCTPWGGSGYDPAVWPPPGLEWLDR